MFSIVIVLFFVKCMRMNKIETMHVIYYVYLPHPSTVLHLKRFDYKAIISLSMSHEICAYTYLVMR